ncbi:hypothetical protein [Pseudomonas sp. P1.31]|uniref:hypothetical protein n=1 Tax=Pseudomonas sp. P1.31 TaxID=1699311 RepID=UPI0009EC3A01|nr:hypothetical protein [Pseudomonas sp. P1.31]
MDKHEHPAEPPIDGLAEIAAAMEAPKVPAVLDPDDPRGLLPLTALGDRLAVTFEDFGQGMAPGELDLVELGFMPKGGVFNNVDERWYPTSDPISWPQTLYVPRDLLSHGVYEVAIRVSIYGSNPNPGDRKTLTIDTNKPNFGNKPGAVIFPAELGGTVDEIFLEQEGEVNVLVPWYIDAESGDRAVYYWTSEQDPPDTETPVREQEFSAEDIAAKRLNITVYADEIRAGGAGKRFLYYFLRDRAGNEGRHSFLSPINVDLTPAPGALPPPRVPLSARGLVDRQQARDGLFVEIDQYDLADSAQWVAVFWDGIALAEIPVDLAGFPLKAPVPWPALHDRGDGPFRAKIYYKIRQGAAYGRPSPEISVAVNLTLAGQDHDKAPALINEDLALVEVYGEHSATLNTLLTEDHGFPATVSLTLYDAPEAGQLLELHWGSYTGAVAQYKVQPGDVAGQPISFIVPWHVIDSDKKNPALPVFYTTDNGVNQQQSLPTHVRVDIVVIDNMKEPLFPHAGKEGVLHCCARPRLWEGVTVRIPADPNIEQGDTLIVIWQGCAGPNGTRPIPGTCREIEHPLPTRVPGTDIDIVVADYDRLIAPMVNNGSALVYYKLRKSGGGRGTSRPDFVIINRTMPSGDICSPTNDVCQEN